MLHSSLISHLSMPFLSSTQRVAATFLSTRPNRQHLAKPLTHARDCSNVSDALGDHPLHGAPEEVDVGELLHFIHITAKSHLFVVEKDPTFLLLYESDVVTSVNTTAFMADNAG